MEVNPLLYVPEDMNVTIGTEQRAFFFFFGVPSVFFGLYILLSRQCFLPSVFWALIIAFKTMSFAQCFWALTADHGKNMFMVVMQTFLVICV